MKPVGPFTERDTPEGPNVERGAYDFLEVLIGVEGEEPLRLVKIGRPYTFVVASSIDAQVEETCRFEDGLYPVQGCRQLASGQMEQAVERIGRIKGIRRRIQIRQIHHVRRKALLLAQRDHLG